MLNPMMNPLSSKQQVSRLPPAAVCVLLLVNQILVHITFLCVCRVYIIVVSKKMLINVCVIDNTIIPSYMFNVKTSASDCSLTHDLVRPYPIADMR